MSIATSRSDHSYVLCALDRKLILATQSGLFRVPDPWGALGE